VGPLHGIRVIELAGIGPGPFAAMMLADMGADVIRVDRVEAVRPATGRRSRDVVARGRRSIGIDLKHPLGAGLLLRLVARSDVLIEGFRPGVAERMGVGPDACLARNPRLVYGRMTGWGQDGPLSSRAGHDINYIAVSGTLDLLGRADAPPTPPANLIGDFGGGGMLLAFGVTCALLERSVSGRGQVIDAAMVDGAALLATFFHTMELGPRGTNLLDTGAPFYDVYECADGRWVSVGALEPQFYAELRRVMGLAGEHWSRQLDRAAWPSMRKDLTEAFASRTRDEWCAAFDGVDACVAPVLSLAEAPRFGHNATRGTFAEIDGVLQPAPAPRFSRTPPVSGRAPVWPGTDTADVLADLGLSESEQAHLRAESVVRLFR
jgi:alpha-methylacyl-CoA racemase